MTKLIYADLTYILRGTFFKVYRDLKGTGISEASWEEALCTVWQAQRPTDLSGEHDKVFRGTHIL